MSAFELRAFTVRLIGELLFYDEEYGAIGSLSLIDISTAREAFIAYYVPENETYTIEKVTAWEPFDEDEDADIGYAFAAETEEHLSASSLEPVAEALMKLAEKHDLMPGTALMFEEEES